MNRILGPIVGVIASLGLMLSPAHAAGLPLVVSATVDHAHGTLTINGQNFGSSPTVTLDALTFPTQSAASSQIVANFPAGHLPSSFTPGLQWSPRPLCITLLMRSTRCARSSSHAKRFPDDNPNRKELDHDNQTVYGQSGSACLRLTGASCLINRGRRRARG